MEDGQIPRKSEDDNVRATNAGESEIPDKMVQQSPTLDFSVIPATKNDASLPDLRIESIPEAAVLPTPLSSPKSLPFSAPPTTSTFQAFPAHEEDQASLTSVESSVSSKHEKNDSSSSSAVDDTPVEEKREDGGERRPRAYSMKKTLSHDNVRRLSAAEMQSLAAAPESLPIAVMQHLPESKPASRRNSSPHKPSFSVGTPLITPMEGPSVPPLPPMSLPTHLQLELAAQRPSPLYILGAPDVPYESNAVKFERLKNVLLLPPYLERTLYFGALACLDAWLYTFTILPMRFCIALGVLMNWWAYMLGKEVKWLVTFVWSGLGRLWARGRMPREPLPSDAGRERERSQSRAREPLHRTTSNRPTASFVDDGIPENGVPTGGESAQERSQSKARDPLYRTTSNRPTASFMDGSIPENGISVGGEPEKLNGHENVNARTYAPKLTHSVGLGGIRHRRTKSMPSNLSSFHKADLLQGAVILFSSMFLMNLDASRMYHFIRAQSAFKLYVIYNALEVCPHFIVEDIRSSLTQYRWAIVFSRHSAKTSSSVSSAPRPFPEILLVGPRC
jgi:hypothetical protein